MCHISTRCLPRRCAPLYQYVSDCCIQVVCVCVFAISMCVHAQVARKDACKTRRLPSSTTFESMLTAGQTKRKLSYQKERVSILVSPHYSNACIRSHTIGICNCSPIRRIAYGHIVNMLFTLHALPCSHYRCTLHSGSYLQWLWF